MTDAAFEAIRKCEDIVEQLGAKITCGGEIEFWAVVDPHKMPSLDELKDSLDYDSPYLLPIINRLFETNFTEDYIIKDTGEDASRRDGIEKILENLSINRHINKHNQCIVYAMLNLAMRVYDRAASEGISLNPDFHFEDGNIIAKKDHGTIMKQGDWLAQKLEITTAIASPLETAMWLDRTREIIAEEGKHFGLIADFRDKPSYTFNKHNPQHTTIPGAGMHIHYGLTSLDGSINLMQHQHPKTFLKVSKLYEACADGVTEVLRQGGFALACPSDNAYDRFNHGVHVTNDIDAGNDRIFAVRKVGMEETLHQEVRTPGANTLGNYAVLLATLGIVEGLAEVLDLGKTAKNRIDPWRTHLKTHDSSSTKLDDILDEITPSHGEKLMKLTKVAGEYTITSKGDRPPTLSHAKQHAKKGSILSAYCPDVLEEIQQLHGGQLR